MTRREKADVMKELAYRRLRRAAGGDVKPFEQLPNEIRVISEMVFLMEAALPYCVFGTRQRAISSAVYALMLGIPIDDVDWCCVGSSWLDALMETTRRYFHDDNDI